MSRVKVVELLTVQFNSCLIGLKQVLIRSGAAHNRARADHSVSSFPAPLNNMNAQANPRPSNPNNETHNLVFSQSGGRRA